MPFASRADLLARVNARKLAQLATPADIAMPPDEALRIAINAGDLTIFTAADQTAVNLALAAIDKALADADAFILSYGIPATVQTSLLARLSSTVALYYLQGTERLTEDISKAYEGVVSTLKSHARGELNLIPTVPDATAIAGDVVVMESNNKRYMPQEEGDW